MARLRIDVSSPVSAYEQISSGLRTLLVSGELKAGDPLPTVRRLAMDLGVHHNTVAEAYRILAAEGWLDLRRGRGAVVLERRRPAPSPDAMAAFGRQLQELMAKAIAAGLSQEKLASALETSASKLRKGGKQ
jgi:DNA-binding transcriptional regulator YhcF (GntR family)